MEQQRIEWIDSAKGMGIILMVFAHCLNLEKWPFQIIYVFHMPMFFVLSGYVFKRNQHFIEILKKRFKSLIIPYGVFLILGTVVTFIVPSWRETLSIEEFKRDLWLADPNAMHNSSIWFLVCMFWVQLLFWIIEKVPVWIQVIILWMLYAWGIYYSRIKFPLWGYSRLPLNLDVVPIAIVFFAIGYWMKRSDLIEKWISNIFVSIAVFVSGLTLLIIFYKLNGYVNLHGLYFGNAIIYLMGGICGTMAIIGLAKGEEYLSGIDKVRKVFKFYGENSLIVLGIQSLLIRLYIECCNQMRINLQLFYFPLKHTLISTMIITFIICPIVCIAWKYTKVFWRKRGL